MCVDTLTHRINSRLTAQTHSLGHASGERAEDIRLGRSLLTTLECVNCIRRKPTSLFFNVKKLTLKKACPAGSSMFPARVALQSSVIALRSFYPTSGVFLATSCRKRMDLMPSTPAAEPGEKTWMEARTAFLDTSRWPGSVSDSWDGGSCLA